jgi:hypothetical protein
MAPRSSPRSLRAEYNDFVEREVEDYKNSVSTSFLHSIATEAARTLDEGLQLGMREVMLADEVDKIIARRLRLPSYETWRKRRLKTADELRRPEHWGLRPDTPLAQAIPPGQARGTHATVLVAGPRVEGSALFLAANGCEVTAVEPEVAVVNRVLRAAHDAGLTEKVRARRSVGGGGLHAGGVRRSHADGVREGDPAAAEGDGGRRRAPDRDARGRPSGAVGRRPAAPLRWLGDQDGPGTRSDEDVHGEEARRVDRRRRADAVPE